MDSGIEKVITKINEETAQKINEIDVYTTNKIDSIIKHFEKIAEEDAEKIRKQGEEEILAIKRQIISNAEIEAKDMVDKEKFIWVEKVFEEAMHRILNLSDKEKKEILEKMCNIPNKENFIFYVDKKYKNLLSNIKIEEAEINDFGVIIKSKDGKITIDNTLTNRINVLKQHKKHEVAKILFGL